LRINKKVIFRTCLLKNAYTDDFDTEKILVIYIIWNILGVKEVPDFLKILKNKHLRKVFHTKVVWFKMTYLLILSIWVAPSRSNQGQIDFFKRNTLFFKYKLIRKDFTNYKENKWNRAIGVRHGNCCAKQTKCGYNIKVFIK